jgi:hypothetical protein
VLIDGRRLLFGVLAASGAADVRSRTDDAIPPPLPAAMRPPSTLLTANIGCTRLGVLCEREVVAALGVDTGAVCTDDVLRLVAQLGSSFAVDIHTSAMKSTSDSSETIIGLQKQVFCAIWDKT